MAGYFPVTAQLHSSFLKKLPSRFHQKFFRVLASRKHSLFTWPGTMAPGWPLTRIVCHPISSPVVLYGGKIKSLHGIKLNLTFKLSSKHFCLLQGTVMRKDVSKSVRSHLLLNASLPTGRASHKNQVQLLCRKLCNPN